MYIIKWKKPLPTSQYRCTRRVRRMLARALINYIRIACDVKDQNIMKEQEI